MISGSALATSAPTVVLVESQILGTLSVREDELYHFPAGLFGFPECRTFVMLATERDGFFWLQSADHGALAFVLADPFAHFEDYAVDLSDTDRRELEVTDAGDVAVLAIVTLPHGATEGATVNLQGPLALNTRARRGKQLALQDGAFGVRTPLPLDGSPN